MIMHESGPDDTQAPRYSRHQMTHVSKTDVFSQLPNCEIGSVCRNSKCYMECFSMPFTKM